MMQSKLKSLDDFEARSNGCDCIWLLKEIQGITHRFEGTRNVFISLNDAWSGYYNCRQGPHQTLHEYLKVFQGLVQVLEHYGAALGADGPYQDSVKALVMTIAPSGLTKEEYKNKLAMAAAKKKSMAISFLKGADRKRYGGLWSELENNFTRGVDHYPADLTGAYGLLLNYKSMHPQQQGKRQDSIADETEVSSISFLPNGASVPGKDGVIIHGRIKCFNCQAQGHYAGDCPGSSTEGVQMLQLESTSASNAPTANDANGDSQYHSEFTFLNVAAGSDKDGFIFNQSDNNIIPDTWILLDSQSTVSVFKNPHFLSDIKTSCNTLRVHTNGGTQLSSQVGTVKNFGEVWFNTESLANILSMAAVRKVCRITTMDTSIKAALHVHRKDGTIMKFKEYRSGLF
jgi:hypothetical protein